jgi:DNA-binding NtrC family response regulator
LILVDATDVDDVPTLVTALRWRQPDARILVGTAAQDWTTAREVLRAGALDYLDKAMAADELRLLFQRILEAQRDPYLGIDVA